MVWKTGQNRKEETMSKLRITPLNIVAAGLLTWVLWRVLEDDFTLGWVGLSLLLVVAVVVADQFFRAMLKTLKRVWLVEGFFVILVFIAIWMIRLW